MQGRAGEMLGRDLGFTEGPVWTHDGRVLFTSVAGAIFTYEPTSKGLTRTEVGCGPTGLVQAADEEIYVAACSGFWGAPSEVPAGIHRLGADGLAPVLTEGVAAPNDLCFGPDGLLYFTDPVAAEGLESPVPGRVLRLDLETSEVEVVHEGGFFPNGLAWPAEGDALYVSESFGQRVVRYPYVGRRLGEPTVFCEIDGGQPDGMAYDTDGNLWVCVNATDAIHVIDPTGELIERFPTGEGSYVSNCCFGGLGLRELYATTAGHGGLVRFTPGAAGLALRA